jgi:glycosyltransferase involved in cell wall biosynthesis
VRLLHIIPTYKPATGYGGPIISIGLLCENLVAHGGCDVTVAATNANVKKDLPVHSRTPVLVEGVKVYYFRRITPDHSQLSPSLLWWLWRNVRQFEVVHLHSWWNLTVLFATMVCILRGVKPVLAPRGMLSPFSIVGRFKPVFHRFFGQKLLKRTFLHATSQQEVTECQTLIPNWEHTNLPNFLDLTALPAIKNRANDASNTVLKLLFLSRLHEKKGIELLFEALAQVPFDWSLTMAGDGESDYLGELKKLSENWRIAHKINWLGWINATDKWAIIEQADLLVLPSHNENFANVVIESLAVGTPVLVSQYVGLSDYVLDNKLGWVCDTTVASIREKLTLIHHQTAERRDISERSPKQIRQDFDPSVLTQKYLDMYANLTRVRKPYAGLEHA